MKNTIANISWETLSATMEQSWVGFDVKDQKGREVGSVPTIYKTERGYELYMYSGRDGKSFGAIPQRTAFSTMEEAKAAAVKKVDAVLKRVFKNCIDGVYQQGKKKVAPFIVSLI